MPCTSHNGLLVNLCNLLFINVCTLICFNKVVIMRSCQRAWGECHVLPAVPQPGDLKFKIGSLALVCLWYVSAPQFLPFVSHTRGL